MKLKTLTQYFKFLIRGLPAPDAEVFQFVKPGMLVFDVGANRGNYSRVFLNKGARVISIEPQKDCVDFMKLRFAFTKHLTIVPSGAGSKPGEQKIFLSSADATSSMNARWVEKVNTSKRFSQWNVKWDNSAIVSITTLDLLIKRYGLPDYVKIDVEGFETEVLKGLTQPVRFVSFEYTVPEMTGDAIDCINYLSSIGSYTFKSQLNTAGNFISRDEIIAELNGMNAGGELHNGDILASLQ